MKIELLHLEASNILTFGDTPLCIDFDNFNKSKKILITGINGAGKSSIGDIISYAFFDKMLRNSKKQNIINDITECNLNIYIEFKVIYENDSFDLFKIYKNKATKKSNQIIKIFKNDIELNDNINNLHIFDNFSYENLKNTNIVTCLNKNIFNMSIQEKREYFENIFNLEYLNELKEKYIKKYKTISENIKNKKYKIDENESIINKLNKINSKLKNEYENEIKKNNEIKNNLLELIDTDKEKIKKLKNKYEIVSNEKPKYISYIEKAKNKILKYKILINENNNKIKFFNENNTCNTCNNNISEEYKIKNISIINEENNKYEEELNKLNNILIDITNKYNKIDKLYNSLNKSIILISNEIKNNLEKIKDINEKYNLNDIIKDNEDNINSAILENDEFKKLIEIDKSNLNIYNIINNNILNDDGYRYYVISSYIDDINNNLNSLIKNFETLQNINIFIKPDLDIIITNGNREKDFEEFSKGEQQVLYILLLIVLLQLRKNNKILSFYIFDELFDTNLSEENTKKIISIIFDLFKDDTIFIVSHKVSLYDLKFDNIINITKNYKNFSEIEII